MPSNVLTELRSRITAHQEATLVTSESCGALRAAQVNSPYLDSEGRIWCAVGINSSIVVNIECCPDVLLLCPSANTPISISGNGFVITHRKIKQNLWARAEWSTNSIDPLSSEVVLVCITIRRVEYWDTASQRQVCHHIPASSRAIPVVSASDALPASH